MTAVNDVSRKAHINRAVLNDLELFGNLFQIRWIINFGAKPVLHVQRNDFTGLCKIVKSIFRITFSVAVLAKSDDPVKPNTPIVTI